MRAFVIVLIGLLTLAVPIRAAADEAGLQPFEDTTSKQVRMPVLVAPLVAKGRLQGYIYLQVIIVTPSRSQAETLSLKIPYLQDAFVREVHRQSISLNDDPKAIDGASLKARLRSTVDSIAGTGYVEDILFENANAAALEAANGPAEVLKAEEKPKPSSGGH